jgi:hypothetical protein
LFTIKFPSRQFPSYAKDHLQGRGQGWGVGNEEWKIVMFQERLYMYRPGIDQNSIELSEVNINGGENLRNLKEQIKISIIFTISAMCLHTHYVV